MIVSSLTLANFTNNGDWLDNHVIDQAKETAADVKDWAEDTSGKVGEAVSSGLKSINPFD
ncbi:hypothetical protein ACVRZS_02175 [Streptococcus ferus]|uniref:hypothetical protein n=1 Tax=Streptococcus ferus TaxID=1345 RepID=UPI0011AE7FBF|nr:hypothetical protein [Streptococcus ferus]